MNLTGNNVTPRIDEEHMTGGNHFSRRFVVGHLVRRQLHAAIGYFHVPAQARHVFASILGIRANAEGFVGTLQLHRSRRRLLRGGDPRRGQCEQQEQNDTRAILPQGK